MTREQIEKAALICAGAGEYGELPYNPDAKKGFIAGAGWRINSAWHDGKEIPKMNEYVLMNLGHRCLVMCFITIPLFLSFRNRENIVCWAYISDLLPDRKEETNGGR